MRQIELRRNLLLEKRGDRVVFTPIVLTETLIAREVRPRI